MGVVQRKAPVTCVAVQETPWPEQDRWPVKSVLYVFGRYSETKSDTWYEYTISAMVDVNAEPLFKKGGKFWLTLEHRE